MADDSQIISISIPAEEADKFVIRQAPPVISIGGEDGTPLVKIHPDGTLEYGPNYDPDEAARRFWDSMRHHLPTRCPGCGRVGLLEGPQ